MERTKRKGGNIYIQHTWRRKQGKEIKASSTWDSSSLSFRHFPIDFLFFFSSLSLSFFPFSFFEISFSLFLVLVYSISQENATAFFNLVAYPTLSKKKLKALQTYRCDCHRLDFHRIFCSPNHRNVPKQKNTCQYPKFQYFKSITEPTKKER